MRVSIAVCLFTGLVLVGYLNTHPSIPDAALAASMLQYIWLPTAAMALLTGALFASSGFLIQTSLDNDFASPSTIGIASGALLGAVVVRVFVPDADFVGVWLGAFLGATTLSLLVLSISRLVGGGKLPIVLIGMALGLGTGALGSIFLLYFEHQTDGLFVWGSGQVLQTSDETVTAAAMPILLLLASTGLVLPKLSLLVLGDTHASRLGLAVQRWRRLALLLAIAQAATATAVVGLIGFVGLMAPHLARYLALLQTAMHRPASQPSLVPQWLLSLLVGALVVLAAEWCSRSALFLGYRLPTGAFTALLGTPFFVWLLLRQQGRALAATEQQKITFAPLLRLPPMAVLLGLVGLLVASVGYWLPAFNLGIDSASATAFAGSGMWITQRIALAGFAGFGLACAGTLLQTLFNNPMASPDISGVSAMSVLVIACLLLVFPAASTLAITIAALLGAGAVIALLGWGLQRQLSIAQVALLGITLTAFAGTATHILLTFGSTTASVTLMWLTGTTYGATSAQLLPLIALLIVCTAIITPFLRDLDVIPLGGTLAGSLGIAVARRNRLLLAVAALLTAICVANVGAISFVGLLAPHCARLLGLHKHQYLLPCAGLTGAILLIWADGLGRSLFAPNEIAAGLMVSILGCLYFLLLLLIGYRKSHESIP